MTFTRFCRRFGNFLFLPTLVATGVVHGCGDSSTTPARANTGTLHLAVRGGDSIREDFVSKDGWTVSFDHFYASFDNLTAYQVPVTASPKSMLPAHAGHEHADLPDGSAYVVRLEPVIVDLASNAASTIVSTATAAPIGNYNYVHFDLTPAPAGEGNDIVAGYSLVLQGEASRGVTTVVFVIRLDENLAFRGCGPTTGAIVAAGGEGTAEITLHADRLFGNDSLPTDAVINLQSIGFDPFFATIETDTTGPTLEVDQRMLATAMTGMDYNLLLNALNAIGHTGEAPCNLPN